MFRKLIAFEATYTTEEQKQICSQCKSYMIIKTHNKDWGNRQHDRLRQHNLRSQ